MTGIEWFIREVESGKAAEARGDTVIESITVAWEQAKQIAEVLKKNR